MDIHFQSNAPEINQLWNIPSGIMKMAQLDKIMDFYLGLLVGFVVGLWVVFCGLLFKKMWRYAYSRY
jgi:hypothetical protein